MDAAAARAFIIAKVPLRATGPPPGVNVATCTYNAGSVLQLFVDLGAATAKATNPHATHFTIYNPLANNPAVEEAAKRDVLCFAASAQQCPDNEGLQLVPRVSENRDRYAEVRIGTAGQLLDEVAGGSVDEVAVLARHMLEAAKTSMRGTWIRAGDAIFPPLAWAVCPTDADKICVSFSSSLAAFELVARHGLPARTSAAHAATGALPPAAEAQAAPAPAPAPAQGPAAALPTAHGARPDHMDFQSEHPWAERDDYR